MRSEPITGSERTAAKAECLAKQGFPADAVGSAVVPKPVSESQSAALEAALDVCEDEIESQYPGSAGSPGPKSDEELTAQFQQQVEVWECLREEGYRDIPPPPSVEAWIEQWRSSPPWDPYTYVAEEVRSEAEWDRVNSVCPQAWNSVVILWDPLQLPDELP